MKKLLITTDCEFPGSALASRLLAFVSMFQDLGYQVSIISAKTSDKKIQKDVFHAMNGYQLKIVSSKRSDRLKSFLGNENLISAIEDYLQTNEVDLVFSTSLGVLFNQLLNLKNKYHFKLLLEQCEWLDVSSFGLGEFDPRYIVFMNNLRNNYKKADGIIAISRLLEDYYQNLGCNVIRIPSIINLKERPFCKETNNSKIKLAFTGNISKSKELLKPIIEAIIEDKKYKEKFELNIYGSDKDKIVKNTGILETTLNEVNDVIQIHGFVPQEDITNILMNTDYQIFIRPERRSSNAGFPTKLCESMSVGTPCITNNTGDISLVLEDGVNGFIVNGVEKTNIQETFNRIIQLNKKEYSKMRENARKSSLEFFDYLNYIQRMEELINKIDLSK